MVGRDFRVSTNQHSPSLQNSIERFPEGIQEHLTKATQKAHLEYLPWNSPKRPWKFVFLKQKSSSSCYSSGGYASLREWKNHCTLAWGHGFLPRRRFETTGGSRFGRGLDCWWFVYEDHNQNPFHLLLKVVDVCKSGNFSRVITTNYILFIYTSLVNYRWRIPSNICDPVQIVSWVWKTCAVSMGSDGFQLVFTS